MILILSIPIGGSQSGPRRHLVVRNDHDTPAHLHDQFAQIVELVIDLRVAELSNFYPTAAGEPLPTWPVIRW